MTELTRDSVLHQDNKTTHKSYMHNCTLMYLTFFLIGTIGAGWLVSGQSSVYGLLILPLALCFAVVFVPPVSAVIELVRERERFGLLR